MMTQNWLISKVEQWPIAKLLPYARNARTHSDDQVAQIAASISEFRRVTNIQDSLHLNCVEFIHWLRSKSLRSSILFDLARINLPALQCAHAHPSLRTSSTLACTAAHRLLNQLNELMPLLDRGQSSPTSSSQRAFNFFRNTSRAAVSARAFSFRLSSRSNSRMRCL